jgi:hypothetical protein
VIFNDAQVDKMRLAARPRSPRSPTTEPRATAAATGGLGGGLARSPAAEAELDADMDAAMEAELLALTVDDWAAPPRLAGDGRGGGLANMAGLLNSPVRNGGRTVGLTASPKQQMARVISMSASELDAEMEVRSVPPPVARSRPYHCIDWGE